MSTSSTWNLTPDASDVRVFDISTIKGNVSDHVKQLVGDPGEFYFVHRAKWLTSAGFGQDIMRRLVCTELSINQKAEEQKKDEVRMVVETEVFEDMLNGGGNIHGGCSAFLVDVCSTLALIALNIQKGGPLIATASQSLNLVYHSPAAIGDKLRIVNTTLTTGARAHSVRTEIWNVTHHRLVVSGTHILMVPSARSPPKANL